jgi:ketosteroid isomerase-like protein
MKPESAHFAIPDPSQKDPQRSQANGAKPENGAPGHSQRVTPDEVRAAVSSLWDAWTAKSSAELADAYAFNSVSFRVESVTVEPGFKGIAQRTREYFHEACITNMELGAIEVVLLSETTALAIYAFHFRALNRATARGTLQEEEISHGRVSQVFRRDPDGKLRILHEHCSSAVA